MEVNTKLLSKKLPLIIGVALIVLFSAAAAWWLYSPSWMPLFGTNGSQEMRSEAIEKLMEWNITYKENEANGFIMVDKSEALAIRNRLNELGISNAGGVGFEIFSETDYGMSEFTQRINYQRALEGELSRTIRSFVDLRNARVHLSMPKESIFKDKQLDTKASVVIQTRPGQVLTEEQVYGIGKLISASVTNLKSDDVIVIDDKGKVLSSGGQDQNNNKQYASHNVELAYTQKARELVAGIAQTSDIQIAVNAKLNFDKVRSVKDQIIPSEEGTSGYLSKIKKQSNVNPKETKEKSEGQSQDVMLEEEYLYTREKSEIEYASGQIESVSVGVVVIKDLSQAMISNIEKVVASGLGLDVGRGDRITVVAIPPSPVIKSDSSVSVDSKMDKNSYTNSIKDQIKGLPQFVYVGVIALIVVIFLLLMIQLFRKDSTTLPALNQEEREQLLREIQKWIETGGGERVS